MTSISPFYIQKFSANMFNISLLFTIFWSFIIDEAFIDDDFKYYWLCNFFIFGFVIVILGTVIFSSVDRIDLDKDENKEENTEDNILKNI